MKIVFNLHDVGLGNNGGSKTLIRCAENMAELGAEVVLFTNYKVKYNWHKINKKVKIGIGEKHPKCDVSIATGYNSVPSTASSKAAKKFYYIRGYELWQTKPKHLDASYRKLNCIVNSEWLQSYLKSRGIDSKVLYPGLDFDLYENRVGYDRDNVLGALFHKKHATKRHDHAIKVADMSGYDLKMLNRDIKNPPMDELVNFYNNCKVWFAPTELEGLHNPPMESALCGAALVCTDHERGGMVDYAVHEETALVYEAGNLKQASKYVNQLMNDDEARIRLNKNMVELLKTKIGNRQDNMKKFLDYVEAF